MFGYRLTDEALLVVMTSASRDVESTGQYGNNVFKFLCSHNIK